MIIKHKKTLEFRKQLTHARATDSCGQESKNYFDYISLLTFKIQLICLMNLNVKFGLIKYVSSFN